MDQENRSKTNKQIPDALQQEAKSLDVSDGTLFVAFLAGAIAVGLVGAALHLHILAEKRRQGERETIAMAGRVLMALRTAEPYTAEVDLKMKVLRVFTQDGVSISVNDLPNCPPVSSPRPSAKHRSKKHWDPFIAYAGPDRPTALGLHARLVARGLRAFIDCKNIDAGQEWPKVIPHVLKTSKRAIVLLSGHTQAAWFQSAEILRTVELHRQGHLIIIPVHLTERPQSIQDIHYGLETVQALCLPELGNLDVLADVVAG